MTLVLSDHVQYRLLKISKSLFDDFVNILTTQLPDFKMTFKILNPYSINAW